MVPFVKMHGIGNDFVMVNGFKVSEPVEGWPSFSSKVCDRHFGVGSDGIILALPGKDVPFEMRMFNPDGSEAEMCGNGIRCMATFVRDEGLSTDANLSVMTGAGLLGLTMLASGEVRVDMGTAGLKRSQLGMIGPADGQFIDEPFCGYKGTAVSMGNPHVVIFVDDVAGIDLARLGPAMERDALFTHRVNVHFVQIVGKDHLVQRTWERGAGITLACGTGACACGVAAFLNGLAGRHVQVDLPGGRLSVEYCQDGTVFMTGPAERVFDGVWLGA